MNYSSYASSRLDQLADGIFAIVMTILVFDIKTPNLIIGNNFQAYRVIVSMAPLFFSYLLSFATLFTYWRGYHSTVSDFARNADMKFQNLSAMFLFVVALIPFSSHFLGLHSHLPAAVIIFSFNVMAIGLILLLMRVYAWKSESINNKRITRTENNHSFVRILVPVVFAVIAIYFAPISTTLALSILTLAILFNLLSRSSHLVSRFLMNEREGSKKKISNF